MHAETAASSLKLPERWGPALGILAVVLMAASFVFAANGPGSTDSDSKIVSWYTSSSHQWSQMLGWVGFVIGVLCLIGFLAVVRERIAAVEEAPGVLGQLVLGAGIASAALFALAIALFAMPASLAFDTSAADIVPASYRMFYTAAYASWVVATMVGALTVWGLSAVALRTGLLPRWFAWLGVVVGVIQLLAWFFIPGFVFWGWLLIAAVLLLRRKPVA